MISGTSGRDLRWAGERGRVSLLGLASVAFVLRMARPEEIRNGSWTTNLDTGSTQAGIYLRAQVALGGLLALSKEETIYFGAREDDEGEGLSGSCDYRMEGSDLGARWWSITAYGSDFFLIPNPEDRYSFTATTVERESGGDFVIHVSATEQARNWLPVAADSPFDLIARLYNPESSVYENPAQAQLPRIRKVGCR